MNKFRVWLSGKKTYLVSLSTILSAIILWVNGADLDYKLIIEAILAMTLRAGISKNVITSSTTPSK
jgi:hypothetical protein